MVDKATGELVEKMTYQGYGSVESDYRPGRWGAFREEYRFTGKEEDSEVGLVYFGMRYLNTALGRWASADPLTIHGAGADLNVYAYVHGRVLRAIDPVGLEACDPNVATCSTTPAPSVHATIPPPEAVQSNSDGSITLSDGSKIREQQEVRSGIEKMSNNLKSHNAPSRVVDHFLNSRTKAHFTVGDEVAHFLPNTDEIRIPRESLAMWENPNVQLLEDVEEFKLLRPDAPLHEIGHKYVEDYARKFPDQWQGFVALYRGDVENRLAGIVPPEMLKSNIQTFADRYTDEAIATRYGMRLTAFVNLKQELNRFSALPTPDSQNSARNAIEKFNMFSKSLGSVGYVEFNEGQIHLGISMPKDVKKFVDDHMLEGKLPNEF